MDKAIQTITGVDAQGDWCLFFQVADLKTCDHVRYLGEEELVERMETYDEVIAAAREAVDFLSPDIATRMEAWSNGKYVDLHARLTTALQRMEEITREAVNA